MFELRASSGLGLRCSHDVYEPTVVSLAQFLCEGWGFRA